MRTVDIAVFCTAQTKVNESEVKRWLEYIGCTPEYVDEIETILLNDDESGVQTITDPALIIALAAKRCYMSFEPGLNPNVTKIRKDWTEYLDNVLKQKHGSVLEHSCFTFAIEGCSRVFTGEMNRHRAGVAISEGSMRFIRYTDIPYWLPTSIRVSDEEKIRNRTLWNSGIPIENWNEDDRRVNKKLRTQDVFKRHYAQTENNYATLQEIWKDELASDAKFAGKKHITSMMRRIIPMGVATGGKWTMNVRAARHIIAMRASEAAEEEILYVFSKIAKYMVEQEPMLFGDFTQTPEGYWVPKYAKV